MATPVNETSTKQELIQYIRETHGVEPDTDATQRQLVKMVKDLDGSVATESTSKRKPTKAEEVMTEEVKAEKRGEMLNEAQTQAALRKQRKKRIIIHSTSGPGGTGDVYLGINGRAFILQREVEIAVPASVVGVLNDAKRKVYTQKNGELIEKEVHSYPFSVLGDAKIGD